MLTKTTLARLVSILLILVCIFVAFELVSWRTRNPFASLLMASSPRSTSIISIYYQNISRTQNVTEGLTFLHIPKTGQKNIPHPLKKKYICIHVYAHTFKCIHKGGTLIEEKSFQQSKHTILWGEKNKKYFFRRSLVNMSVCPFKYRCSEWHLPPSCYPRDHRYYHINNTKFCVIRNPYTRIFSDFEYNLRTCTKVNRKTVCGLRHQDCTVDALNTWIRRELTLGLARNTHHRDCHLCPQFLYVFGHYLDFDMVKYYNLFENVLEQHAEIQSAVSALKRIIINFVNMKSPQVFRDNLDLFTTAFPPSRYNISKHKNKVDPIKGKAQLDVGWMHNLATKHRAGVYCNHILRFEHLREEFNQLMDQYNLSLNIDLSNVQKRKHAWQGCHDDAIIKDPISWKNISTENIHLINSFYWMDFLIFNYSMIF
ncbi:hypothetical protein RFI_09597 [Reticulomyxa filosa]|uniref:Carbohydrate sulfotransferase n=1 Tax=Reticulomyxa filosa TaxID=46433 RepID=X6NMP9_RETFI|nr:hypothetical protein RFI_09597 [Reticulomyxa filosa]|eukprot:ETO27535.1 hypothetical protein RFI_09597 [Reticulomyxa filosa]